jgi:predicted deacetylase
MPESEETTSEGTTAAETASAARGSWVCISVHDVAPATWPDCRRLLELIDAFGPVPVTLLVVPDYHGRGTVDRDPAFVAAIERRLARQDEVALHGYRHLDDSPPPRSLRQWVERRLLTRGEGEFAALDQSEAGRRIERGLRLLRGLGWPVEGFVPPAWLLGGAARRALGNFDFSYYTTRTRLVPLHGGTACRSPSLVYSVGAPWRHAMSRALNAAQATALARQPLLRLSLHPVDAHHPQVLEQWRRHIGRALATRVAVTKSQACRGLQRDAKEWPQPHVVIPPGAGASAGEDFPVPLERNHS